MPSKPILKLEERKTESKPSHFLNPPINFRHFNLEEIKIHFDDALNQIQEEFTVYQYLINNSQKSAAENLLRLQLVYLGGALDFYFHELIRYGLLEMFLKRWTRSSAFKKISVPLIDVENAYFDTKNPFDDETNDWFFILI